MSIAPKYTLIIHYVQCLVALKLIGVLAVVLLLLNSTRVVLLLVPQYFGRGPSETLRLLLHLSSYLNYIT